MGRHLEIFKSAWICRGNNRVSAKRFVEQEFLPATLAIQERPPSPLGRLIHWSIILLSVTALAWAALSRVEILAVAQGRVIPGGMSKKIQPLERGVVHAIHVREGQRVEQGALLIELEEGELIAQREKLRAERSSLLADQNRFRELVNLLDSGENATPSNHLIPATEGRIQQRLLQEAFDEYQKGREAIENRILQRQAEITGTLARIEKQRALLPLVGKRLQNLKVLMQQQMAPEQQYLELDQKHLEARQELKYQNSLLRRQKASLAGSRLELERLEGSTRHDWLQRMEEARRRQAVIDQELAGIESRIANRSLRAPVNGRVQQLSAHTLGGVVSPAEQLMVIVPDQHELLIEAMLANKDIGFVTEGQNAEMKVEAFPFTRFGTLKARVSSISRDAVEHPRLGLVYTMYLRLFDAKQRQKEVQLTPGMKATAEIKTGHRRLIEYFLSPLMRYRDESLWER